MIIICSGTGVRAFTVVAGKPPLGFRAPSWSVGKEAFWALPILEAFGFVYDASVFPIKNFLYGLPAAPLKPFFPRLAGGDLRLLEVPVSVFIWGSQRLPYSGGLYFNLWPWPLIRYFSRRRLEQGGYNLFYFHPWDLWPRSGELTRRLKARWLHLHLGDPRKKFERVLIRFRPRAIADELVNLREQAGPAALTGGHVV
jgi:hypothetical protein